MGVRSLGWEDPLQEEMATHSSILAWEVSWTEEPGGLQSMGSQRLGHDLATERRQEGKVSFHKFKVGRLISINHDHHHHQHNSH